MVQKNKELLIGVLSFNFKNFISLEYSNNLLNGCEEQLLVLKISLKLLPSGMVITKDQVAQFGEGCFTF
jgi:hypothetical protein